MRFAFQPLYSLHTGGMVAVEALARPADCSPQQLLGQARSEGRLIETDIELAARAIAAEAEEQTLLPLHVNLLAVSAASRDALTPLVEAMTRAGRRAKELVVEVGPPFTHTDPKALVEGIARLHGLGFQVALDGLGVGDLPLAVLAATPVEMLKVDRSVLRRLPEEQASVAIVEALLHIANRTDARLVATGIERPEELEVARELGIRFMQGNLFASAQQRLSLHTVLAPATTAPSDKEPTLSSISVPTIADFIRPPATLPANVTCDDARQALADDDSPNTMVGVDEAGRPRWTIDRSRFLLEISGRYGHALHAAKPAERFADAPHTIQAAANALDLLDIVADADADRMYDDFVVIDRAGVCLGVVRVAEVVRGVAEVKIAEAATLNPLTGLPSSDTIAKDVDRRISIGEPFVAACLDVDKFKLVNDRAGFAAGDELIRTLGRTLTELAAALPRTTVSHVGGDDFLIAADMDELGTLAPALLDTRWTTDGLPVNVSLAGLVCAPGSVASYAEVSGMLAGLRQRAKKLSGNNWVLGRPGVERVDVIRGRMAEQHSSLSA